MGSISQWWSLAERRWLMADQQGSIIGATGADGTVLGTPYAYGPYGEPDAAHGYALGERFRYTGQITLRDAPLWHYKARAYSPELGRFLQTDPVGYEDQLNLYAYVANDPVNGTDPTGMVAQDPVTVGAGVGCAVTGPACPAGATVGAAVGAVVVVGVVACVAWCDDVGEFLGNVFNNDADAPQEQADDDTRTPAPALEGDPYNPAEVDRRRSGRRNEMGAPSNDPDSPIPDQGPRENVGGHTARGRTPHVTGERNVNPNEEYSRRPKGNPTGRPR